MRMVRFLAIVMIGLMLGSCDLIDSAFGPTHRYILKADGEAENEDAGTSADYTCLIEASLPVLNHRMSRMGVTTHSAKLIGSDKLSIETSGLVDREALAAVLAKRGTLAIKPVVQSRLYEAGTFEELPPGTFVASTVDGRETMLLPQQGGIGGNHITNATMIFDPDTNEPAVAIQFDAVGAEKFGQITSERVGLQLAAILDGQVIFAPVVTQPILNGSVQIEGGFSAEDAARLAVILDSGPMPVAFEIIEERSLK